MRTFFLSLLALAPASVHAEARPVHPELKAMAAGIETARLHADIAALVGFGTRHTLSDTTSPTRGIGAARAWVKSEFEAMAKACDGCLSVEAVGRDFTGERVPTATRVEDVLAIQPGTSDPDRVIVISGHIDSRVSDVMNFTADAPGANDDASGVATVLEAARALSHYRFPATIVYAVTSGEEQGLYGGTVLAETATARHWRVEAALNNDIVGNTHGQDGRVVSDRVRVFSEGTKSQETPAQAAERKRAGGELDSPSRNLARFMAGIAEDTVPGLHVDLIMRADRFGRGGDQLPMQAAGFPAVRVSEADENYQHQHQDLRTEGGVVYGDTIDGVDFAYLTKVARLNTATLAALALAPAPSDTVKISGAVTPDTTLSWSPVKAAVRYRVWRRDTTSPTWTDAHDAGNATALTLKGVNIDNSSFGVSSVSADGYESPVQFPGYAGAFFVPVPKPAGAQ